MTKSHKSQSGPVIVRKVADPQPLTPDQQKARLKHKLALIDDRIADRESWNARNPHSTRRLETLLIERAQTVDQLRGVSEDALNHSPAG